MGNNLELDKKVLEMTPEEKEKAKQQVLKTAGENINAGKKFTKVIRIDNPDFPEYKGDIVIHRPTLFEDREIGIRWSRYKQTIILDPVTDNLCLYFATFDVIVDEAPDWFKPQEMFDYTVLDFIWEEYADWRNSFRIFNKGKLEGDSKTIESKKTVVDSKQVQSSSNK